MIVVIMGGVSAEREISLESGTAVLKALESIGVDACLFNWTGNNLDELWKLQMDKAFVILHGPGGEDGYIQAELEQRGIPFTGSDSKSSRMCMSKTACRSVLAANNLPIAPGQSIRRGEKPMVDFPFPWAVKPDLEGSSFGISKVKNIDMLEHAIELGFSYGEQVLVERWIEGDECTAGIVGKEVLPIIRIIPDGEFYNYNAKYQSDKTQMVCPADISNTISQKLSKLALKAFKALDCQDWGRVDFMVDKKGEVYILEINTIPGMTGHSLLPTAAKASGLSFEELVRRILTLT